MTVLELFCGIGGCAAAIGPRAHILAAVDQHRLALRVYHHNFPHPTVPQRVESFLARPRGNATEDLWWMSPPCPPFTRRGLQRDLDDTRARSFVAVLEQVRARRPRYLALENVPGFVGSRAHGALRATLDDAGYTSRETLLCPSELGLPNRRQRFYLVASLDHLADWPPRTGPSLALPAVLDPAPPRDLWCDPALVRRYPHALDVVDPHGPAARTACFTAAYGRSPVRSGSYLATPTGLRHFSPAEILRLLDFPESFRLPADLPLRSAWPLVGNSVSVRAVRWVLAAVPALGGETGA